jgi:SAM-dependent methyltransferase
MLNLRLIVVVMCSLGLSRRFGINWKFAMTRTKHWVAVRAFFVTFLLGAQLATGQDFGDTPYVQTPQNVVDKMLEIAKVTSKDYLIDLGSGDGRLIITAAKKYGARGFGVDLDKTLVILGNRNAAKAGVANRAVFYERDLHETDLTKADVITIYLLPEVNLTVRPRILALKPGTRLVSHDYGFGEWPPDQELIMDAPGKPVGRDKKSKVLFWTVPARVAGKWAWQQKGSGKVRKFELSIDQVFQKITGTLSTDGRAMPIENAVLNGNHIRFDANLVLGVAPTRVAFKGIVVKNAIKGETRGLSGPASANAVWSALRTEVGEPRFTDLIPMPMAR